MERSTVMIKNIHGGLPQQQTEHSNSLPYISFPHKTTFMRDASFSAYIRPDHHQADDSEISIFDAQKYFNESSSNVDAKVSKRVSPVNVINLERISEQRSSTDFSAAMIPRFSSASSVDGYGRNYRACSFNATPTASSEASWNSQTGLLSNPPGAIPVSMKNTDQDKKRGSFSSKWLFGGKCPCSGKKSVQVEEKLSVSEPKTPAPLYTNQKQIQKSLEIFMEKNSDTSNSDWSKTTEPVIPNTRRISAENRFPSLNQRIVASGRTYNDGTGFSFPILNQSSSVKLVLNSLPSNRNSIPLEDPPRESLEIFHPPSEEPVSRKSTDFQNRMLVCRQSFTFPPSPSRTRMTSITDDDVASDASSDLFEIESFSTQTTSYPMYQRRDSLDEASSFNTRRLAAATNASLIYRRSLDEPLTPSIAATECYEPSEASIDWSVTTAEGFDRVSASEFDDMTMMRHENTTGVVGGGCAGGGGGVSKKKGNGSLLLSCRCEKAVSVGPNPVKCVAGSSTRHVSSGSRTSNVNNSKPPLARSPSDGLSIPFAT